MRALCLILICATSLHAQQRESVVPLEFEQLDARLERRERFDLEKHIPAAIRKLDGQRVRIRGYMMPTFEQRDIRKFVLEHEPQLKFGDSPTLDKVLLVELSKDNPASFTVGRIDVEGKFVIEPFPAAKQGDPPIVVYRLREANVVPKSEAAAARAKSQ